MSIPDHYVVYLIVGIILSIHRMTDAAGNSGNLCTLYPYVYRFSILVPKTGRVYSAVHVTHDLACR